MSQRLFLFLSRLASNTEAGEIKWQETASDTAFRVGLGQGVVRVELYEAGYDEYVRVVFLDRSGRELEQLSSPRTKHSPVVSLYDAARRSARNFDQVLETMEDDLSHGRTRELPGTDEDEGAPDDDLPF